MKEQRIVKGAKTAIAATVLLFLITVSFSMVPVSEASTAEEIDGIYYYLDSPKSGEATVTAHADGYQGDVIIPATVTKNGILYNVTEMDKFSFSNNPEVESVSIGENVKKNRCPGIVGM